jgi:hypothetical protein
VKEERPRKGAPHDVANVEAIVPGATDERLTPHDRVIMALAASPRGPRRCPSCPDGKFGGFKVSEAKTRDGAPTVLLHCHRECTVEEVLGALGLDPADLFSSNGQTELFDGRKFAIVELEGWLALPPSSARSFGIAGACGQFVTAARSAAAIRGSGKVLGYYLDAKRARTARELCEITPGAWRLTVFQWKRVKMAHRCPPSQGGVLSLFRRPEERCPNCGESVSPDKRRVLSSQTPGSSVSPELGTKALALTNASRSYQSPEGAGHAEEAPTEAAGEVLELRAMEPARPQQVRRVPRCRECKGEAGHEPDYRSRPLLTGVRQ